MDVPITIDSSELLYILGVAFAVLMIMLCFHRSTVGALIAEKDLLERKNDRLVQEHQDAEVERCKLRESYNKLLDDHAILKEQYDHHISNLEVLLKSNLDSMPWLAGMMADFLTYDLEVQAKMLEWGDSIERRKKVASIRELRKETQSQIEQAKIASYQLAYVQALFPGLEDVLLANYADLEMSSTIPEHDYTKDYLSSDEWLTLPPNRRDQLALDRYIVSHKKSNWQIGRDYELSVAHQYISHGYTVELFGSLMKYEDLGRDLIAKKGKQTLIIQCKYWAKEKVIHEKHIFQLYGTTISYSLEHNLPVSEIRPVFVTNITLSETAKKVSQYLNITVRENHRFEEYPRIKCNVGRDEYGQTKIYHLPMDQQYDSVKIRKNGEFYAFTVQEAVSAGFRRAFRWHGDN